jgi:hypothetical protein
VRVAGPAPPDRSGVSPVQGRGVRRRLLLALLPDPCHPAKHNAAWWAAKLATNVDRDRDTDARLAAAGWVIVRVWEHEDPCAAADLVEQVLAARPRALGT